ncbi:alpha/beta hydrolase [Dactylosporangium salmoneum]|uniref:Alpha/beta hydrolase n=1 Tax=Dactylosporangium salmoneum TaxID=53361 RepID=A0ABP5TVN1_9ACTN
MGVRRDIMQFSVDGLTITALTAGPADPDPRRPLIAALPGGTYNGRYFDVPGSARGSFLDTAVAAGYRVVSFDRPGYGASTALDPAGNTFDRHAELLDAAIAQAADRLGAGRVFLVGHSIGGMIAVMIAAAQPSFRLAGLSVTGMGAVINANGAADALAQLPADATVDLPYEERDKVMFGPEGTYGADAVAAAHGSYAPVPVRELIQAPRWPVERLPGLAPHVRVPVHNALAEHDLLWDSAPEHVARFAAMLTAAPFVEASVARGTGHSIDHHTLGHALHLRQLAFAEECALWDERR